MNPCKLATALALAALLGACASPSPPPVLLTLPPSASAVGAPAAASAPVLAVRRVVIPEYLVARRVRYRADASTLAEWPNTYWAERIEIAVSREYLSALRAQLPGWAFCDTNCGDQTPALGVQLELVPMDYLRGTQKLQARARITLSGAGAVPRVLQTRELPIEIGAGADTAQAHAQAIAEAIRQAATATAALVVAAKP